MRALVHTSAYIYILCELIRIDRLRNITKADYPQSNFDIAGLRDHQKDVIFFLFSLLRRKGTLNVLVEYRITELSLPEGDSERGG